MQRGKQGGAFYVAFDKENFYFFVKIFLKKQKNRPNDRLFIELPASMLRWQLLQPLLGFSPWDQGPTAKFLCHKSTGVHLCIKLGATNAGPITKFIDSEQSSSLGKRINNFHHTVSQWF